MSLRAFTMPKWGIEMAEGVLTDWTIAEGDGFTKGQVLASVETDKIVNDIEAEFDAVCLRRLAEVGDSHPVGALLAVMGEAGTPAADIDAFIAAFVPADAPDALEAEGDNEAGQPEAGPEPAPAADYEINTDLPISPAARETAAAGNADLSGISGSGQGGRILKQDVEQLLRGGGAPAAGEPVDVSVIGFTDLGSQPAATPVARQFAASHGVALQGVSGSGRDGRIRLRDIQPHGVPAEEAGIEPFDAVRARIASRLTAAARDIPHFYLDTEARVDALLSLRKDLNQDGEVKISVNDFIVKAVADTLMEHPNININVLDEGLRRWSAANVGIAVARDDGLVAPVIAGANAMSLAEISTESRRLATGARDNNLQHEDFANGTFTVSNLGMYGITRFTAIINPPQGAILSVGTAVRRPVEADGGVAFGDFLTVTLGCDHRAIDGAMGAAFLADLRVRLEQPESLLAGMES
ncbi:MAG: dihydrolipoamide acetyltransferase family protein [Xanthomonadales bacterium]|nr:dihydrolipoamide acetyltransferase family protein [Xanthomonadales bacterium]